MTSRRLPKEVKAVVRELRRHDREVEAQLERIANAVVELQANVADLLDAYSIPPRPKVPPPEREGER